MFKSMKKVFAVVAAVLVALVVVVVVLASVLVTPERIKAALLPLAEEQLQRKVELGEVRVSLLSGVEILGLRVFEEDERDIFLSTELVRLRYRLLPLLAMKVVIDEIRLEQPRIRVVRFHDGHFNFGSLMAPSGNADAGPGADRAVSGDNPVSLLVAEVLLQDGQVLFLDHVLNDRAPYRYELSALQLSAKGVSLTGQVPLSLECRLNGSPVSFSGHVSLVPPGGEFVFELQNLDAVPFLPYLQDALPGKLGSLKLNVKATLAGSPDQLSLKGSLALEDLDLLLDAMPDSPVKDARLAAIYDMSYDPGEERLELRQFEIDYNGSKVNATGAVTGVAGDPVADLRARAPALRIGQLLADLPHELSGTLPAFDPTGTLAVDALLSGRIMDPAGLLKSATIDLDNVQANVAEHRPALSGRLQLVGDQLSSEGLQVRLGDNNADLSVSASHLFSRPIVVKADISSERFLLEPLLQGSAGPVIAADRQPGRAADQGAAGELGPFELPLYLTGTTRLAEAQWQGLTITGFLAQYELRDNIFVLSRMEGQVAGGSFQNKARIDLGKKGLSYTASLELREVQADPLLTAFVPAAAGSLLGAVDLSLAVEGRGTRWQSFNRSLTGDGRVAVTDGRLIKPELVSGLRTALRLPDLQDISFSSYTGQFKIVDGRVRLDSRLLGETLKLFPQGTIGLDGSLDLGLDARLSPALSKQLDSRGEVTRYLADSDGWTRVPLQVRGSFSSPQFGLDPQKVQEQAVKALGSELGRQLDKFFRQPAAAPANGQPASVK